MKPFTLIAVVAFVFPRAGIWRLESPELWAAAPPSCSPARRITVHA